MAHYATNLPGMQGGFRLEVKKIIRVKRLWRTLPID